MTKAYDTFNAVWHRVRMSPNWKQMEQTVEDSQWHREANVAVHTTMTIEKYLNLFAADRTDRQRLITLTALLFHDFGKPEAEEEKPREDGSLYRSYAGHEPVSANEFMSYICKYRRIRQMLFNGGLDWTDIRRIKVMIEHHLPYGLEKAAKRIALRSMLHHTLGDDYICFYDMLRSDGLGRISDDHEAKTARVNDWIAEFDKVTVVPIMPHMRMAGKKKLRPFAIKDGVADFSEETFTDLIRSRQPSLIMLYGVSGAGKSTWVKENAGNAIIFSEDPLRLAYAEQFMNEIDHSEWSRMTTAEQYDAAWKFCHMNKESKFDSYSKAIFTEALAHGRDVIVDRMNQGRKGRSPYIEAAKQKGFKIVSIEFYIDMQTAIERQASRGDKFLPPGRVRQIYMQQETPWYGAEVDAFTMVPPP